MTFEMKLRDVREEERMDLLGEFVDEGTISIEQGAEKAGMSVPEFAEAMKLRKQKEPV